MAEYIAETGDSLIRSPGYLVIKPMSPAILRVVEDNTIGSRLEGVSYIGTQQPVILTVREQESMTG